MITSTELTWMRSTEELAMTSSAMILKPYYSEGALGDTEEYWAIAGTVACDVWPIARNDREKSSGNQEISRGDFFISVPFNADVSVTDILSINDINYQVTFVPKLQSWLTNQRVEAYNYNSQITVLSIGAGTPVAMSAGTAVVYINILDSGTVLQGLAQESTLQEIQSVIDDPFNTSVVNKSSVVSGTVSQSLLSSNLNRNGVIFFNDGTADLYFNYGTVATTTNYTLKMVGGSYWEMPNPIYKGQISGLWNAAVGSLCITETENS